MTRQEQVLEKVKKSLTYLSEEINSWVLETSFDHAEEGVIIVLHKNKDRSLFCSLLYASGLFHQNDSVVVVF
jgi:hypothetical protein